MRLLLLVLSLCITASLFAQQVTIFEQPNFSGRSKAIAIGQFALSDFNDQAASIRVPRGMVAVLYEHASGEKGYGISVDLLEDCTDLAQYGFSKISSFISVFPAEKDGRFVYVRGTISGGQYIAGHWERKRVNPIAQSPTAVVSPSLPAPVAQAPTQLQVAGGTTNVVVLGRMDHGDHMRWQLAVNDQEGIIGNDYRGIEEIGSACFQRPSNNMAIPDRINFWYPQKQRNDERKVRFFKRTLAGTVRDSRMTNIGGTFKDYDVCIDIVPAPKYQYLITDAHPRQASWLMKTNYYGTKILPYIETNGSPHCNSNEAKHDFTKVEAEITEAYWPQGNKSFGRARLADLVLFRTNQTICVYGTWVSDAGHCHRPEIHPAEQLWWQSKVQGVKKYHLNVLCDASRRFWWRRQMDDGTKMKPWGAPPIKGLFAIAFECNLPTGTTGVMNNIKEWTVENIQQKNVASFEGANQIYNLVYQGQTLLRFRPNNNCFKVSFEKIGTVPEAPGKVRGFLVIETAVGKVTQLKEKAFINNFEYKFPFGTSPELVPQFLESQFFKKEEGNYLFVITEKSVRPGGGLINGSLNQ